MKFGAIPHGLFGPISVNRKLRQIWEAINLLSEQVKELRQAAGIIDKEPEAEPEEEPAAPVVVEFDWRASEDVPAILEWAAKEYADFTAPEDIELDELRELLEAFIALKEFDWRTTEDIDMLRDWALNEHGLAIQANVKKVATARSQIEAFLKG